MSAAREAKYTDEQRAAVAHAAVDRGIKPVEVARLAAAGELEHEGQRLKPFEMPPASVGTYAFRLKRRRAAQDTGEVAGQPHRDAVEVLRKRLVQIADRETNALKRKRAGTVDPERLRQTARAVREIAALPGPTDPTPPAPGAKVNGQQHGGQTRGGLSGSLLADHRATAGKAQAAPETKPAPNAPPHTKDQRDTQARDRESEATSVQHDAQTAEPTHDDGTPGGVVHALAARLGGAGVLG